MIYGMGAAQDGEAKVAMDCFGRLHPLLPGAQGVIYDTALRKRTTRCFSGKWD